MPDGSYSTDPYKPDVRIREFKQMVQALHKAGIRVDVYKRQLFQVGGNLGGSLGPLLVALLVAPSGGITLPCSRFLP